MDFNNIGSAAFWSESTGRQIPVVNKQKLFSNLEHVERLQSMLMMHLEFNILFRSINSLPGIIHDESFLKDVINQVGDEKEIVSSKEHVECIEYISIQNMLGNDAGNIEEYIHRSSGSKFTCFEPMMRLSMPFRDAIESIESKSQFELLLNLIHMTGFIEGIFNPSSHYPNGFVYLNPHLHDSFPAPAPNVAIPSSLSLSRRTGCMTECPPNTVHGYTDGIYTGSWRIGLDPNNNRASNDFNDRWVMYKDHVIHKALKPSITSIDKNKLDVTIAKLLPSALFSQLADFVQLYITVAECVSTSSEHYNLDSSALTRAIILKPILDMISHNYKVLHAFGIEALTSEDDFLQHFQIWLQIHQSLNKSSGNKSAPQDGQSLIGAKHASFISDICRLERKILKIVKITFDAFISRNATGKKIKYLNSIISKRLPDYGMAKERYLMSLVQNALGYCTHSEHPHAWEDFSNRKVVNDASPSSSSSSNTTQCQDLWHNKNCTSFTTMSAKIFKVLGSRRDNLRLTLDSLGVTILDTFGEPDFTLMSKSGAHWLAHSWILLSRWPYFRDMSKSNSLEIVSKRVVFNEIDERILQCILMFIYCCDQNTIPTLFTKSDIDHLSAFFNEHGECYKLPSLQRYIASVCSLHNVSSLVEVD